ncbi:glyoxalase/bleomycin resistance/extradiol dioxygenase family protein [Kribbella capetownensis]|uniref:Glyoxalase/bleomycin resistance/extradiol dioxygenase family protein n=1 Tax=Kribbella capetownensis TaxID=1572659 RepID=A0A4R0K293_9ACTN|nr:VOC family protein [Kribbella capetownensis]TCC52784.1 glyoxalase/bleomycin resistance/extradiol dioxygenase family protein [Kribbella capetownensis]
MQPAAFGATVVTDRPAEVAAFYQQYFDLQIAIDLGWFITVRRGEADWELAICQRGHATVPAAVSALTESTNVFGFVVDDADKVAAALTESGVPLETQPVTEVFGQRHFFVRDPAGTWLDVIQLVAPDPAWLAANTPAT